MYVGDNERVVEPEGSAKIFLRRKDPYGFWYISFERGPVPESLSDAYTTIMQASQAIDRYLINSAARKRAASTKAE